MTKPSSSTKSFDHHDVGKTPGEKHDGGKEFRFHLFPIDALHEVARVLTRGARKYTPHGWLRVEHARARYYDAAIRHMTAWYDGERDDPDHGTHHLANACCSLLFLLALDLRGTLPDSEPPVDG